MTRRTRIRTALDLASSRLAVASVFVRRARGFTLIEMMVSVAIIAVIASIVVYNHGKFSSDLEITNVAYRVALEARQAQVYGISVAQSPAAPTFSTAYGLHFNTDTPTQFIFFNDIDGNGKYSPEEEFGLDNMCSGSECVEQLVLGRGNTMQKLCYFAGSSAATCVPMTVGSSVYALDIMFRRPRPDAIIYAYGGSSGSDYLSNAPLTGLCSGGTCDGWAICLQSPQGRKKQVVVLSTGQISVENVAASGSHCS